MSKIVKPDLTYQWASAAGGGSVAPSSVKIQTGHIVEKPNYEYMNWLQNRQDTSIAYTFQMGVPEWDSLVEYQYHANYKSYVQRNGLVYKALQVGTNKDPATEAAYWTLAFDNYGSAATVQSNLTTHISNYNAQAIRLVANGIDAELGTTSVVTNLDTSIGIGEGYYDSGTTGTKPSSFGLVKKWRVSSTFVYQLAQTFEGKLAGRNSDNSGSTWTAWRVTANELGDSTKLFQVANGTTGYEAVNKSQLDTKASIAGNAAQEFAVATATTGNSAINLTQLLGYVSSGMVMPFAGSAAPTGWLECNGSAVSRTTYAALFAVIGTLWGVGDGSTTFNLPETRGEFIRGYDNSRGVDSGRVLASSQSDELKAHTHPRNTDGFSEATNVDTNGTISGNYSPPALYLKNYTTTGSTGGSETRPRNVAMMYIIKT